MLSTLDWNLVVTAYGGRRHDLIHALRPIVRLRRAGYSEVHGRPHRRRGRVPRRDRGARRRGPLRAEVLARVVPVVAHVRRSRRPGSKPSSSPRRRRSLDALAGRSFHVRVERRGHRERRRSRIMLERGLGTALVEALRARGVTPHVTFDDPDLIVAVELIGAVGGIGLVSRALRAQLPLRPAVIRVCDSGFGRSGRRDAPCDRLLASSHSPIGASRSHRRERAGPRSRGLRFAWRSEGHLSNARARGGPKGRTREDRGLTPRSEGHLEH